MDDNRGVLAGKRVLVTGGAKRLGRAVALRLAEDGADILLHFHSSEADAELTAAEIRDAGVRAWTIACDLSDPRCADDLMARAWDITGGLDIIVNNAASFPSGTVADMTVEGLRAALDLNAVTPLMLTRAFAARTGEGSVVNILDTRIDAVDLGHAGYWLAKKLLAAVTELTAAAFAPGIRVNGIGAGADPASAGRDAGHLAERAHLTLAGRSGDPEDVADAVLYLATTSYVTGEIIHVDGGQRIRGRMIREEG